jgi:hypothetical protein
LYCVLLLLHLLLLLGREPQFREEGVVQGVTGRDALGRVVRQHALSMVVLVVWGLGIG